MSTPEQDIEAVLEESGPDFNSFGYERPTAGHQGEVFLVSLSYGGEEYEVVIKFQAGDPNFSLEPFLHDYVADRTDVPVPRILVFQQNPGLDVEPYFVTERVRGDNLAEGMANIGQETLGDVIEHAGDILGDMHAEVGFEGFGRLALEDGRLIVDDFSWDWQQFFHDIVDGYIEDFAETPFDDIQDTAHKHIEDSIDVIESQGVPRLVHDDFRPANLLFDPDENDPITAVLDWQFALAGDPEYHVARTEFLFIDPTYGNAETREQLKQRLYEGYRQHREFDPDSGYEDRRAVYRFATLLWRMSSFNAAFAEYSDLAQTRAEMQFRDQFDALGKKLPKT